MGTPTTPASLTHITPSGGAQPVDVWLLAILSRDLIPLSSSNDVGGGNLSNLPEGDYLHYTQGPTHTTQHPICFFAIYYTYNRKNSSLFLCAAPRLCNNNNQPNKRKTTEKQTYIVLVGNSI